MSAILPTQEVGSLAKPDWRVAAAAGREIQINQVRSATDWAVRLGLDPIESEDILCQARERLRAGDGLDDNNLNQVKLLAARYAVRLQEAAGLDIVYDGEQDRSEMYQHAIERTAGFAWRGRVRAFDNKSYKKAACVGEPAADTAWHTAELERLQPLTTKKIKVPVTGAYTLAAWSYDEHYSSRHDLVLSLAKNVLRPNIQTLLDAGADWVQIDEPAATTVPGEVPLFVESFNESVRGLAGKFSVHICFSDYEQLFPHIAELENCSQFSLEFANRDPRTTGTTATDRPAYSVLQRFKEYCPDSAIGLGVTSVHDDDIESPELVRDRILRAVEITGDPSQVYPSPDCGLRTRSWDVAFRKLSATVIGTQLAKEIIK